MTPNETTNGLHELIREAWRVGCTIDLGRAAYGRAIRDKKEVEISSPSTYYPFLAGLVRVTEARRILEIGTNCGGSAMAMDAGFGSQHGQIVTVDINDYSEPYLQGFDRIRKVQGDANSVETIERVIEELDGKPVDMLYIDAAHSCLPTLLNYCIYQTLLSPKLVVLDDITLYDSMRRMWGIVQKCKGDVSAVDASLVVPEIRPQRPAPGFGVVQFSN